MTLQSTFIGKLSGRHDVAPRWIVTAVWAMALPIAIAAALVLVDGRHSGNSGPELGDQLALELPAARF